MKKTKTNPFDWAIIQWARACEEAKIVDRNKVTLPLDPEKDERGRLCDPLAYLAERANNVLASIGLVAKRWIERFVVVWGVSSILVILLGAIVFPFAQVKQLLGGNANLAGPFVFFILGQLFFLTVALVLIATLLFQYVKRRLLHRERPTTLLERAVANLSGVVGVCVLFCLQKIMPFFYGFSGNKRRDAKDATLEQETNAKQKGAALFGDALFSRPRFVFFWSGYLSHLFWTSCSICVLLALAVRMEHNRYDYCWRTSLEDEASVKRAIDFFGTPIEWFGGSVPDSDDVAKLFNETSSYSADGLSHSNEKNMRKDSLAAQSAPGDFKAAVAADSQKTPAQVRKRWSYYLLSVVFFWCVVPRAFLVGVYYFLFRHALGDYRPDCDDPFFKEIINEAESYNSTTVSSFVVDQIDVPTLPVCVEEQIPSIASPVCVEEQTPPIALPVCVEEQTSSIASPVCEKEKTTSDEVSDNIDEREPELVEATQEGNEQNVDVCELGKNEVDVSATPCDLSVPTLTEASRLLDECSNAQAPVASVPQATAQNDVVQSHSDSAQVESPAVIEKTTEKEREYKQTRSMTEPDGLTSLEKKKTSLISGVQAGGILERKVNNLIVKATDTLAFGYDFELSDELWKSLLPAKPQPILYGDVAADFELKRDFREFLRQRGKNVRLCVLVTDVGLSPAKHFTKFLRDSVLPQITNAIFYVVLSGGEKLRVKFGTGSKAIAERLEDWKNVLGSMGRVANVSVYPVFFYDSEFDLPELRSKLRAVLESGADPDDSDSSGRDYSKWDASSRRVLAECRVIWNAGNFVCDEESERRRVAQVCAEIFEIYREETELITGQGLGKLAPILGSENLLEKIESAAKNARSALATSVAREGLAVKESLEGQCAKLGYDPACLEKRLESAWGLSEKMRSFCSKLSPKCAVATASIGLSIPALVAFAPLLGGAATATAVASTFGALGTLLPSTVASGVAAGAIGAVAPMSLGACKKKLTAKLNAALGRANVNQDSVPVPNSRCQTNEKEPITEDMTSKIESIATLVFVTSTWRVVLELQGLAEDEIADKMPTILKPVEDSPLDSLDSVERALEQARAALPINRF